RLQGVLVAGQHHDAQRQGVAVEELGEGEYRKSSVGFHIFYFGARLLLTRAGSPRSCQLTRAGSPRSCQATWRCSCQEVLKLMSIIRIMLVSRAKVTCSAISVRSLAREMLPLASMVMVTETMPCSNSACPWKSRDSETTSFWAST